MVRLHRLASALLVGGLMTAQAGAQAPPATKPAATPDPNAPLFPPIPTDPAHPDYHPGAHRTMLRTAPLPHRSSYNAYYSQGGQGSARYSNPGGVGRYAEYYDANTLAAPVDYHANPVAKFDSGGGPDRAEQMSAQQLGIQRGNSIQQHLDTYGRPMGFGIGFAGGRGFGVPY